MATLLQPDSQLVTESDRLVIRTWSLSEATALHALSHDQGFTFGATSSWRMPDLDHASRVIAASQARFEEDGLGVWPVILKSTGEIIGVCGLKPLDLEGETKTEIVFRFAKAHWGRGFATEAVRATLAHAFSTLHLREVIALLDPQNIQASNVLEKAGMGFFARTYHEGKGQRASHREGE